MSDFPPEFPYMIDNVNFGEVYMTINYSDPAQQTAQIMHFDQLVFRPEVVDEDMAELNDLLCQIIDKVQTERRGPAPRIVPARSGGG